jgi:RNA polymerase sigma factor (sigma-70 family)
MDTSSASSLDIDQLLRERSWLRSLARGLVGDADADDLVQETWLAALSGASRPETSRYGWLGGIVRNLSHRSHSQRRSPIRAETEAQAPTAPGIDDLLVQAELQQRLISAVRDLDEPYRTTVLLRYFEDLSVEELSRRMSVPSSTSRTRLQRALAQLRARLIREDGQLSWSLLGALVVEAGTPAKQVSLWGWIMGSQAKVWIGTGIAVSLAVLVGKTVLGQGPQETRLTQPDSLDEGISAAPRVDGASVAATSREAIDIGSSRIGLPVAEPMSPASVPPNTEAVDVRQEELERIAASFLTQDPDAAALVRLFSELPREVEVDEASVSVDPGWGAVSGKLLVAGSAVALSFTIHEGLYLVTYTGGGQRETFLGCDVSLSFSDNPERENFAVQVQYSPDTSISPHEALGADHGEEFVGWTATVGREGSLLQPLSMQVDDAGGWRIGHSVSVAPRTEPWLWDVRTRDRWLQLLKPLETGSPR